MSEYWESRKIDDIFDKNAENIMYKLKSIYRKQGNSIQKSITEIYINVRRWWDIYNRAL